MNYEIILIIVSLASLLGVLTMIFRRIPILVELPEAREGRVRDGFWLKIKNKIKESYPFNKPFSSEIFLQKILSKVRILTLKAESKTSHWLQQLREKSQKKNLENGNYWQDLKDSTKKGKK